MKYEKILTSWDQCMDRLPKIPKDWLRWQKKVGVTQNFIFYHYSRRKDQTGYCSWSEAGMQSLLGFLYFWPGLMLYIESDVCILGNAPLHYGEDG